MEIVISQKPSVQPQRTLDVPIALPPFRSHEISPLNSAVSK